MHALATSLAAIAITAVAVSSAHAGTVGFVNNPTTNRADWEGSVTGFGAGVSVLDFNSHALGSLNDSFYSGQGVTFSHSHAVEVKAGPLATAGTTGGTSSVGEGAHDNSRFALLPYTPNNSFTVSFASGVRGAGMLVIDLFNTPEYTTRNAASIDVFSGVDGSGTLLGSFDAPAFNFQLNNTVFLGATSTEANIRSIRFNNFPAATGDGVGIDDIRFATVQAVPLPPAAWMGLGLLGVLGLARLRKTRTLADAR